MKRNGFTLAEILITLTVIGVLAAILTPILGNAIPNQNTVLFRKAYNVVVTAVSDLINDEESYPSNILGNAINPPTTNVQVGFNNLNIAGTLVPASVTTTDNATVYSPNKFCYLFSQEVNTVGNEVCPTLYSNGTFTTRNGMFWTIVNPAIAHQFPLDNNDYSTRIVVDVNGPKDLSTGKNGPDCSYVALIGPAYNNSTSWPKCDTTKVWPSNPDTGVANPTGIVPDIYDIGIRYDGKIQVNPLDKAAAEILSTSAKYNK